MNFYDFGPTEKRGLYKALKIEIFLNAEDRWSIIIQNQQL